MAYDWERDLPSAKIHLSEADVYAADHIRDIYRRGMLDAEEFDLRLNALDQLKRGVLIPPSEPFREWQQQVTPSPGNGLTKR